MYENLDGIHQPLHKNLWTYWLMMLVALVLSFVPDNIVTMLVALAVNVVMLYQVYSMREVSDSMGRAWRVLLVGLVLTFGSMLLALLALGSMLSILLLLVTLAGAIVMIVADYYFYAGLDDLVAVRGYDYPAGRIKWCFWLSLIGAVAAAVLDAAMPGADTVVGLVIQAVILVLLWQYLRAVKQNEEGADSGLGGPDDPIE